MNFLENFAFGYVVFAEDVEAYNILIILVAALCIGMVKTVDYRMQRGTYFLNTALIIFATSLTQLMWFLAAPATANGFLSVLVLLDIAVWIISAYALVVITKARSNDAYGHARYAALGFIPIANLWLLFTPSKDEFTLKLSPFLTGGAAVALGLVLSIAGRGIGIGIEKSIEDYVANNMTYETAAKINDKWMSYYISKDNIKKALLFLKSREGVGNKIDEITVLEDINVDDETMEYRFLITDTSIIGYSQQQRNKWEDYICDNYTNLIDAGAMIIWHYYSSTEPVLARIIGNTEVCSL